MPFRHPRVDARPPSASQETGPWPPPWTETTVVGRPVRRVDAYERVSGTATYSIDVQLPGMLHAAILRCPHPHAMIKRVDLRTAELMPGVRAVLSDADPAAKIPWYTVPEGVPGAGAQSRLFDRHCRYAGEEVAAVAAETPHQAHDALAAIKVDYEPLPFVLDPEEALKPDAPALHEGGNLVLGRASVYERGDVARGFVEADVVLEETYRTSCEIHTPTEVHGSVVRWEGPRLVVWDTSQGVFDTQRTLAEALGLPLSQVRLIGHYMGGGFGSKLDLGKYTVIAALLARKTGRPVKLFLTREDSFLAVGNRPANVMRLKAGVREDGALTALELENLGSVGAYWTLAEIGFQVADLYRCANVRIEERSVYINAGQARAFRAPGFPQCSWALEQMMDALAGRIGMDPVAFRLKNVPDASQRLARPYTSTGLARCLEEGASAFGWKEARARPPESGPVRRGVGVAAAMWGYDGDPVGTAIVKLFADGSASLTLGASDLGTGTKTVMAMVVAEELGVPVERIRVEHADTGTTPYGVASAGSQTVLVNAPAVRHAAIEVKRQILEMAAEHLDVPASALALAGGEVVAADRSGRRAAIAEIAGFRRQQVVVGVGYRHPHPEGTIALPFAAQFAEVEVNVETGEIRVLRMLGASDSGRVMNLRTYENQVFGGITMGIGFGLTERRVIDRATGRVVSANWHDYKLPTALDVAPEPVCLPIDPNDTTCNSVGAKGLGEPATIPTAAAIANAIAHATGVRVRSAPVDPLQFLATANDQPPEPNDIH